MKKFVTAAAFAALLIPAQAHADAKSDFADFVHANYYTLDDQSFSKISCKIHTPLVDTALANIRKQLEAATTKVTIQENLKDFDFTYEKGKGISFNKPTFDIQTGDTSAVKDKDALTRGIGMMKNGFEMQVKGVADIVKGVMEEMTVTPELTVTSFAKTADGATVTISKDGMTSTEKYAGAFRSGTLAGPGMTGDEGTRFKSEDGSKLLMSDGEVVMKQPTGTVDVKIGVSYQKAGSLMLPKTITNDLDMQLNGMKQQVKIVVNLDDCAVQ